jgi:hypothetical protein
MAKQWTCPELESPQTDQVNPLVVDTTCHSDRSILAAALLSELRDADNKQHLGAVAPFGTYPTFLSRPNSSDRSLFGNSAYCVSLVNRLVVKAISWT